MTDIETEASRRVATTISNRFYVEAGDAETRIAFGQQIGDSPTRYHVAVLLKNGDADALAELIERLHAQRAAPPAKTR